MTTPRRSYSAEYKAKLALEALKGLRPSMNSLPSTASIPTRAASGAHALTSPRSLVVLSKKRSH